MPASSSSLLAPKGPPGDMGGPVREPALSVALWLSWGAALGAVACAMALLTQQTELQTLRREVTWLQRTGGPSEKGEEYPWLHLREQRGTQFCTLFPLTSLPKVLFHDVTFTMGQVVSREGQGRQETLFRCIRSMPSNPDWAYNSCYSAGVFHLHQGDILSVIIPRARAKLSLSPHGTFLGFRHCLQKCIYYAPICRECPTTTIPFAATLFLGSQRL
nr:tumor necrosis factor ligand superfamily member 13 isoform X5 [Manis javanica]